MYLFGPVLGQEIKADAYNKEKTILPLYHPYLPDGLKLPVHAADISSICLSSYFLGGKRLGK